MKQAHILGVGSIPFFGFAPVKFSLREMRIANYRNGVKSDCIL